MSSYEISCTVEDLICFLSLRIYTCNPNSNVDETKGDEYRIVANRSMYHLVTCLDKKHQQDGLVCMFDI